MKSIDNIKIKQNSSVKEALKVIDSSGRQIAIVVDEDGKLMGTLTDGDIRRGLLKNYSLDENIMPLVSTNPTVATINTSKEEILKLAIEKKIHQIPIIGTDGRVLDLKEIDELIKPKIKPNRVILMVGGLGTRLRPLTETTPKPMLKVGNKPILQTIVEKFVEYGFINITMCVNYKSNIIKDYFGDGSAFGADIDYVFEEQMMGTAGALSLLSDKPTEPFFVMNGDILTNVNFEHFFNYHTLNNSFATMCVREYELRVPYGVVNINDGKIESITEKPTHKFFVSAGIYMLSPKAIEYIPQNSFFDMPTLFDTLINDDKRVVSFPLREYWLDIGQMEEYERANSEFGKVF